MSAIDPFDDYLDLDLDPREPTDEELRDGDEDEWECCFPGECCMSGLHHVDECHTAADMIALEEAERNSRGRQGPPLT